MASRLPGTSLSPSKHQAGTMAYMPYSPKSRFLFVAIGLLLIVGLTLSAQETNRRGRKYKAPPPTSKIEVTILRDANSKPIENASVIFHVDGDKGNMELKSNEDGKSVIDVLPIGSTVRLQVIAKGYQTYGEDFKIDKPEMAFEVKMKRPGEQYSIYKQHDSAADPKKDGKDDGKDADAKDKPKDSPAQPSSPPPPPQ
jgi:hypothetical protein